MADNYIPLKEAANRISGNNILAEELLHYTIDEFLKKPKATEIIKAGAGRFYCVGIMRNSWKSSTSPFFHIYRKENTELKDYHDQPDDEDNTVEIAALIRIELDKLPWYDKMLFETFVNENHTISSLSRATGIPRTSISLSINRIRRHIKRNL